MAFVAILQNKGILNLIACFSRVKSVNYEKHL